MPMPCTQLPPVCHHRFDAKLSEEQNAALQRKGLCEKCHLSFSGDGCWNLLKKYELACQPRFDGDKPWADFMSLIRKQTPTQADLDRVLGPQCVKRVTREQALLIAEPGATALCSHRADVAAYNQAALRRLFPADRIIDVPLVTNAEGLPEYETWLKDPHFHELTHVAIGARVSLTSNLDLAKASGHSACTSSRLLAQLL